MLWSCDNISSASNLSIVDYFICCTVSVELDANRIVLRLVQELTLFSSSFDHRLHICSATQVLRGGGEEDRVAAPPCRPN